MDKYKLTESIKELQAELKVIQDREQYCKDRIGKYYKNCYGDVYKVLSIDTFDHNKEKCTIMELENKENSRKISIINRSVIDRDIEITALEFLSEYDSILNRITKNVTR